MSVSAEPILPNTVVARLTPAIPSAIATIAVHGSGAVEAVSRYVKLAQPFHQPFPLGRIRYGLWSRQTTEEAAEQVVVCRTEPMTVEIHCHGGNAVCQMILDDLIGAGCRAVSAADFPEDVDCEFKREASADLLKATTDRAAAILLDQMNGALSNAVLRVTERAQSHGIDAVHSDVMELLSWSELGTHLVEPWRVVLAGPPNTGKSSLMNAIVGSARAIVHSEPGTTRDWIETLTAIDGWPVALTDTAGLRESTDWVENEGIRRAQQCIAGADLVLFVVDAMVGWTETHQQLLKPTNGKRTLTVWNKIDLSRDKARAALGQNQLAQEVLYTSARDGIGISELLAAIAKQLVPIAPAPGTAVPFRQRHIDILKDLLTH